MDLYTSSKDYWETTYKTKCTITRVDSWLSKYISIIDDAKGETVIDLGCGWGNNILSLSGYGVKPVACDLSQNCISFIATTFPELSTKCFNMADGLPFDTESVFLVIADLSLHYFDSNTTHKVISELHRILQKNGSLLCRVNSTKEIVNKGVVKETSERNFFDNEGIQRRFFDKDDIERFFGSEKWNTINCIEYQMDRYRDLKWLWELNLQKM